MAERFKSGYDIIQGLQSGNSTGDVYSDGTSPTVTMFKEDEALPEIDGTIEAVAGTVDTPVPETIVAPQEEEVAQLNTTSEEVATPDEPLVVEEVEEKEVAQSIPPSDFTEEMSFDDRISLVNEKTAYREKAAARMESAHTKAKPSPEESLKASRNRNQFTGTIRQSAMYSGTSILNFSEPRELSFLENLGQQIFDDAEDAGTATNELGFATKKTWIQGLMSDFDEVNKRNSDPKVQMKAGKEGVEATKHATTYFAETAIQSAGSFIDLFLDFDSWRKGTNGEHQLLDPVSGQMITVDGRKPDQVATALRNGIKSVYEATGFEPTLEEYEDAWDGIPYLLGNIVGGAGALNVGLKAIQKASSKMGHTSPAMQKFIEGFWKSEAKIGGAMVASGTTISALGSDDSSTSKEREQMANLGSILPVLPSSAGLMYNAFKLVRGKITNSQGVRQLLKSKEELTAVMEGDLTKVPLAMTQLVAPADLPRVFKTIQTFKNIKKLYPDFKPSVAMAIDTPDAWYKQSKVDSAYFDEATKEFNRNQEIFDEIINRPFDGLKEGLNLDLKQLTGLIQVRDRAVRSYQTMLDSDAEKMLAAARGEFSDAVDVELSTDKIQTSLVSLKKSIGEQVNANYVAVDPKHIVQIGLSEVKEIVSRHTRILSGDSNPHTAVSDPNIIGWLEKTFPSHLKALDKSEEIEDVGLILPTGFKDSRKKDDTSLNMGEVRALVKTINGVVSSERLNLLKKSPTNFKLLGHLAEDLSELIATKAKVSNDPGVIERLDKANAYYSQVYAKHFKDTKRKANVATKFTSRSTQNELIESSASLGKKLWTNGDTKPLVQFLKVSKEKPEGEEAVAALEEFIAAKINSSIKGSKNPHSSLEAFREKYKSHIKLIDGLEVRLDKASAKIFYNQSEQTKALAKNRELDGEIIRKHLLLDDDTLGDFLFNVGAQGASEFIDLLHRGGISKLRIADDAITDPTLFPDMEYSPQPEEIQEVLGAISRIYVDKIFQKSLDATGTKVDPKKLNYFLETNQDKMKVLLGKSEYIDELKAVAGLVDFGKGIGKPLRKEDINKLRNAIKSSGTSPESWISKQYAAATHRISRVFLVAETASRSVLKLSDKGYATHYRNVMTDWELLERAAKARGAEEALIADSTDLRGEMTALQKTLKNLTSEARQKAVLSIINKSKYLGPIMRNIIEEDEFMSPEEVEHLEGLSGIYGEDYEVGDEYGEDIINAPEKVETTDPSQAPTGSLEPSETGVQEASQPQVSPNSQKEAAVANSAAELLGFRKEQNALMEQPIDRKGTFNPKTGEMTWLS